MSEPIGRASSATSHRWLIAILLAGLVIRAGWGLSRPVDDASIDSLPDQRGYLELGRNLIQGKGLSFVDPRFGTTGADGERSGQTLYATRTPGYPVFIAACGGSVRIVRLVQAVLDTSTALAVYLLARLLVRRETPALMAAALVAFNPFLVYFSALLLTETLYTTTLAWAMVLLLLGRHPYLLLTGIVLLAEAILVRPPGIGLPLVLGTCAVFARDVLHPMNPARSRAKLLLLGAILFVFAAVITVEVLYPWAERNHRVLGRWVWSTSNDGITLYDGFHPGATGNSDMRFLESMPEARTMGELERSDYFAAKAKRAIAEDPGRLVGLALRKIARTWSPVPLSGEFGRPLYKLIALAFSLPFDVLVILGLLRGGVRRSAVVYLLLPALYFTALHAMSVGSLRYRVPAEPPLAVISGVGAAWLIDRRKRNEKERTAPS
jgi:4-amino-4-deoxy-L-arabinose transferase-like glycosyltransferase